VLLNSLLDQQVIFFGGKGGVGKTTCSSAFSLAASQHGHRVLLVSTDPAHSTTDIFETPIGATERELRPGLSALEIDADGEAARYIAGVKKDIERMFSPSVIRQAHTQIEMAAASPGLLEVALLDRMIELIVNRGGVYDTIVFDTAPTGHTMQLLRMPEAITTWIQALVKHRRAILEFDRGAEQTREAASAADPVLEALERRHERLAQLRTIITDRRRTSFVLVCVPERLVIEETARAAEQLAETGVDVGGLVINRVLPEGLEGEFYQSRKSQETVYLREIERRFPRLPRVLVQQLPRDVYGLSSLGLVSSQLMSFPP
jgi:arsenite/tail-anchored protein-transporting ATPase